MNKKQVLGFAIALTLTVFPISGLGEGPTGSHAESASMGGEREEAPRTIQVYPDFRTAILSAVDSGEPLRIIDPDGNELELELVETHVFAPDQPDVSGTGRTVGNAPPWTYIRTFENADDSAFVRFTTGTEYVYGTIRTEKWDVNIQAAGVGDQARQEIQWETRPILQAIPTVTLPELFPDFTILATYTSKMVLDVETGVQSQWADWQAWATAAFNHHQGAWDNEVDVDLQLMGPYGVSNSVTSNGNCSGSDSTTNQYSDWLDGNEIFGAHSYFLFHRHDMDGGCHGIAKMGTLTQGNLSSSVAEGTDVDLGDAYNPADSQERGVLQMHEVGHVHNANHHGSCSFPASSCTVMPDYIWNFDVVNADFDSTSESEIEAKVADVL